MREPLPKLEFGFGSLGSSGAAGSSSTGTDTLLLEDETNDFAMENFDFLLLEG